MNQDQPILLFDSHSVCYRAFHSLGEFHHGHVATGVVFGFLGQIRALGELFQTNRIVFCWDSRLSIRKQWFPWYKEKRHTDKTPEELRDLAIMKDQREVLHYSILPGLGFRNSFQQRGYEADDLIAKLCQDCEDDLIIISTDNDLWQCLRPGVRMYNANQREMATHKKFKDEYGLPANRWFEVKCLAGCKTDEVPGIPGVGVKKAVMHLKGTLPKTGKVFKSITAPDGQDVARRNDKLVRLPLPGVKPMTLVPDCFDLREFDGLIEEYGFSSFLQPGARVLWNEFFSGQFNRFRSRRPQYKPANNAWEESE